MDYVDNHCVPHREELSEDGFCRMCEEEEA